jgi:hypothetical protein
LKHILLFPFLIINFITISGFSQTAKSGSDKYISYRLLGLTCHFIDVHDNASYFPLKLSKNAQYILNPGFLVCWDKALASNADLFWRTVQSIYIDCAIQPAGYLGAMLFKQPMLRWNQLSFGAGFGLGINIRRSWRKYGDPGIQSRLLKSWGNIEGIIGPYSEVELLFWQNKKIQWAINIVPAVPVLAFLTTGIRFNL